MTTATTPQNTSKNLNGKSRYALASAAPDTSGEVRRLPAPRGADAFRAWLNAMMDEAARTGARFSIEASVGPVEAAVILEYRSNIRPERPPWVRLWASEILAKQWQPIPDGPTFDTARKLMNCHHRCEGVVLAGEMAEAEGLDAPSVLFSISFGYPPEAVVAMDRGATRSDSQVAAAMGVKVSPKILAALRWYIYLRNGLPTSHNRLYSTGELLAELKANRKAVDALAAAISQKHPAPIWGVLIFAYRAHPKEVSEFASGLVRKGRDENSPITTLLTYLDKADSAGSHNGRLNAIRTMYALRAWIDDKPLKKFCVKPTNDLAALITFLSKRAGR